ncbi:DUF2267 domain-containing protein [Actinoallomurus rhizosphaericola]|uniref:DUF2267 domain-containing protein n=1 Tax=Actinoallomurus rhizosphaericola TaxID=2952536 RepID=UPI002092E784|nr:DUF2267 domain-containing protein [Actinoallomurus rhizosphaericola]MCO5995702.1 DUF2267 domain-containing protein [Actinoallomurus rhizosphaericola]
MDYREFIQFRQRKGGLDGDLAERAARATLATPAEFLAKAAERIAGGEVDDLLLRLPLTLHGPLRRGRGASGGTPRLMPLNRLVNRIAEPAGVYPFEAREYARTVFATLREAVRDDEYVDVTVQLPMDHHALLPEP